MKVFCVLKSIRKVKNKNIKSLFIFLEASTQKALIFSKYIKRKQAPKI